MFKKSLLVLMLFAALVGGARAQVTIGDLETATNDTYLPMNSLYDYSYTQQIYTADEIGTAGTINAITVWIYGNANLYEMPFDIYMVETEKDSFSGTSDWESVSSSDIVYSGSVTVHNTEAEAFTFQLDVPFVYSGRNNLMIAFDNNCGQWKSGLTGKVFTAEDNATRSLYARRDGSDYDPTNMSGIAANDATASRNVIEIDITSGGGPTCDRPETLVVSDITGYGATCTWESNVGNYTFEYKKAADSEWTVVTGLTAKTYTLSNLEPMTAYNTRVKAVCSADLESGYKTANFTTLEVCPEGLVCIGQGTATNSYLPTYNYYNYSLTEQIYTAEEIGQAGAILSVDIFSVGTVTRSLEFYMVSTEKETFADGTDWVAATESDLLYSGSVTFAANSWNTIGFDNPFIYDGRSNVALIVRDMTGSYVSAINFYVFDAPSQAIRIYRDGSPYDLAAPGTGTVMNVKNRLRLNIGEPPACPKPTGLAVNYEGGTTATVTWNGDAASYQLDVNGTTYTSNTNSYNLTGLELATTYEVKVRANCGSDGYSEWTNAVSFKTDNCMPEDMCALTFVLSDSYGDSWNGSSIGVYDYTGEEVGDLLASVTISSSLGADVEQTTTLSFCNGQELALIWVSGSSYDYECSYTITDLNGDIVAQDDTELGIAYTIDCTETDCRRPSDFVASEIGPHSVVLSWTENGPATEWEIAYLSENDEEVTYITVNTNPYTLTGLTPETAYAAQVTPVCEVDKPSEIVYWTTDVACPRPTNLSAVPYPNLANLTWDGFADAYDLEWALMPASESKDALWLQYDNGTVVTNVGNSTIYEWTWAVMYPADMLQGNNMLSKVAFYETSYYSEGDPITINIYSGGDSEPGTLVYTENVTCTGTVGIHEVILSSFVNIDPAQNLWITLTSTTIDRPMAMSAVDEANGRWVDNGSWMDIGTALASVSTYTFMIRGYVEPGFDPEELDWNPVSGITSPYTLEGLQPETTYVVRVKAVCGGDDGESDWTTITFTTPSGCDMPNTFNAEVEATSATLSWVGYQESFNLKYRSLAKLENATLTENFDEGMGDWTTIDADGDGYTWVSSMNPGDYHNAGVDLTGNGHNGSAQFVISGSYSNSAGIALTPDNYLVSPQIELGGGMEFWVKAQDAGYFAEHFGVAVSTSGNTDGADFTTIAEWTLEDGNDWYKYIVDLSAYTGQGYVAIRHFDCTDMFILNLDDISFGPVVPASDWIVVEETNTPYVLSTEPNTTYEWQVQGVSRECTTEWSEIQTFTTPELTTIEQPITLNTGSNYVSFYVDITMDDLKAAIQAAYVGGNVTIKSLNSGQTMYNGSRWRGSLNTLNMSEMYMIVVSDDADAMEISVEGMPIDPASYPINIAAGTTWFAFQLSEPMTVAEAFAGFDAVNGDAIKSSGSGQATYNNRWRGALTTLQPGVGYIFKAADAVTEARPLVFPTPSKAGNAKASFKPQNVDKMALKTVQVKTLDLQISKPERANVPSKANQTNNFHDTVSRLFNKIH